MLINAHNNLYNLIYKKVSTQYYSIQLIHYKASKYIIK